MKLINRPIYTERIRPFIGKGIIKVLTGQRRVGKSCILMQLMEDIKRDDSEANIIYINMEHEEFRMIHDDSDLFQYLKGTMPRIKTIICLLTKYRISRDSKMFSAVYNLKIVAISS